MANVPTSSWSETSPAGSDKINAGDNAIRLAKTQIREVIDVDHDFPSSGQAADVGQHKRCTFQEQADLGSGATGVTILGGQTISGKPELVYTDEDDNDVQITKSGKLHAPSLAGVYPAANVAALATMLDFIYPVGTIYSNASVSTNPGTLFGIGTWVAIEGTVIAGYKSGDATYGTAGATIGAATVNTAHTHTIPVSGYGGYTNDGGYRGGYLALASLEGNDYSALAATSAPSTGSGGNATQSTLQPTLVVYCWKRTA